MCMMQIALFNSAWLEIGRRYNIRTNMPIEFLTFVLTDSLVLTVIGNGLLNGGLLLRDSLTNYSGHLE